MALPNVAGPAWQLGGAGIISCLALVIGLVGRRRFAAGVGEALFVIGLSGILVAAYLPMHDPQRSGVQLCAVLTALAILWRFAPRRAEATSAAIEGDASASGTSAGVAVAVSTAKATVDSTTIVRSLATLLCGAAVAGISLRLSADAPREQRLAIALCLMLLLALTLRPRAGVNSGLSLYGVLGLLGCALRIWLLPHVEAWPWHALAAWVCVGGLVALVAALGPIFTHWRRRQRAWLEDAERLLAPPPRLWAWWTGVQALAGLTGIAALVVRHEPLAPIGPGLAALAASAAGYRLRATSGGVLTLVLSCETVILAALAWLPDFGFNALAGVAVAGCWMVWLAGFWRQQLLEGQAWTFAGQLIEPARRMGWAAAVVCFSLGAAEVVVPVAGSESISRVLWSSCAFAAVLLLGRMLIRDAAGQVNPFGAAAGGLATLAALAPLGAVVSIVAESDSRWPLLLGLGVLLLAALTSRSRRASEAQDCVYDGLIGGFLPVAMVSLGASAAGSGLWLAALPMVLVGFGWRWRREGKLVRTATLSHGSSDL